MRKSEPSASLWLRQASSDYDCAEHLRKLTDPAMYCHIIAKYQQTVEKAVKGVVSGLNNIGASGVKLRFNHEVDIYIAALLHLPRRVELREVEERIKRMLSEYHRSEIAALSGLAPRQPAPGKQFGRNTEYPFQNPDGSWTVPAVAGVFRPDEIARFHSIALKILDGSQRIIPVLDRIKPVGR